MTNVFIDTSAITQESLSFLRDKQIDTKTFRQYADRIAYQLLSFSLQKVDTVEKEIETPLEKTTAVFLKENIVFVTILRAGLSMLPAALSLLPQVPVGFLGLKRDEETAVAKEYYCNLPKITPDSIIILADPMLATGGSMTQAIERIQEFSPKEIRLVSVICAPDGIAKVQEKFGDLPIYTAVVDSHLNDKKYIVPGLGDFGDRYFAS